MAISIGRLSGGNTPADGSDPRTFPAIWNATADTLEGLEVGDLADATVTSPSFGQPLTYDPVSDRWVNDSGNYPVMVFADSSARSSAIPSPLEGMVTYREDANRVEVYDGSAFGPIGGILQVVSTTKTDTFTTTSDSFLDVTGLSVSITPTSSSSKIIVMGSVGLGATGGGSGFFRLMRDTTPIFIGDSSGSRTQLSGMWHAQTQATFGSSDPQRAMTITLPVNFFDSPATTSEVIYKVQARRFGDGGDAVFINRSGSDGDGTFFGRTASTITLMEVAV